MADLLVGWLAAFAAGEAGAAFALAGVAEGFVEGAVGAFGRIGEDARDDELGLGVEGRVGRVAGRDLLLSGRKGRGREL